MKKLLLAIFLLALSLSACTQKPGSSAGSPDYLLVKKGFKNFKLGDPIEKYDNVRFAYDDKDDDVKLYKVIEDSSDPSLFKVGKSIELHSIRLVVYKGRIMSIKVTVKEPYREAFLDLLQAEYGKGVKEQEKNADIEKHTWNWNASNMRNKVRLVYTYKVGWWDHEGWAFFYDVNIEEEQLKDLKNKAKENIKDL